MFEEDGKASKSLHKYTHMSNVVSEVFRAWNLVQTEVNIYGKKDSSVNDEGVLEGMEISMDFVSLWAMCAYCIHSTFECTAYREFC